MAHTLVAQVGRDGSTAQAAPPAAAAAPAAANNNANRGFFARLFSCCFAPRGAANVEMANRAPGTTEALLPPIAPEDRGKKCLVLDLDETLVHSSFKPVANADFIIPVEIDDQVYQVYVLKRPRVDDFMKAVGEKFEVVIFTASLSKYADPVIDLLDKHRVCKHRLFREACTSHKGNYVKDLLRLGRPIKDIIIIDNSPASYAFQPENAVPIESWFDDTSDCQLLEILGLLSELAKVDNVVELLEKAF